MTNDERFLILGGAGLVGMQIARRAARELRPRQVVIVSLYQEEVREALHELRREFHETAFDGFWGDVFMRADYNRPREQRLGRTQLLASAERRNDLYDDLYGDPDAAYARSQLVQLVLQYRPHVVVDAINTATAISYQDVFTGAVITRRRAEALAAAAQPGAPVEDLPELAAAAQQAIDTLLLSQAVPQLIRHVILLRRAMVEAGTRLYIKIGTTGTGGMGLNIPYTHSEDRPSALLMSKTAVAFAHTGLMFLMARTPGGPIVKEIKPGAMIGYADITRRAILERGQPMFVYTSRTDALGDELITRCDPAEFKRLGRLRMVVADTGENGLFTRGEFETITHLGQMEFMTPEEIAREAVLEIQGANTGHDVIAAIDGAVMNPTYRAGYIRRQAIAELARLEQETHSHSVALGQLGPPEISKLLWEAHLLKLECGTLSAVLEEDPEALAARLFQRVQEDAELRHNITSIGLPILTPDGAQIIRGPFMRIPQLAGANRTPVAAGDIERWAAKGWLDLRAENLASWQARFRQMQRAAQSLRGRGSAAITREAYHGDEIEIGEVVGWIFNNEEGGYRIK
jgi:NAD(P)-dependent dehydrogenase (short-subunit alcohol dehydrogenase family)